MVEKIDLPEADLKLYSNVFEDVDYFSLVKEEINWQEKEITLFGKKIMQPRLVAFYGNEGVAYKYSGQIMQAELWSSLLVSIKNKVEKVTKASFNSCLLNYYRDGNDSMGWHQDNEKELGNNPTIASVSFGATRVFKLKHISRDVKMDILLSDKSLLLMSGATQHYYKHAIPKTKKAVKPRINLTFRTIV